MIAFLLAAQLAAPAIPNCTPAWITRVRYLHTDQPFGQEAALKVQQADVGMTFSHEESVSLRNLILKEGWAADPIFEGNPTEFRVAPGSMLSVSAVRFCCRPSSPFPWVCHEES